MERFQWRSAVHLRDSSRAFADAPHVRSLSRNVIPSGLVHGS
jgi:hypothetical protein